MKTSVYTDPEKEFLKLAKKLKDILKLEKEKDEGKALQVNQEKKLETKPGLLKELVSAAKDMPTRSELWDKHAEITALLPESIRNSLQQKRGAKQAQAKAVAARPASMPGNYSSKSDEKVKILCLDGRT